MADDHWRNLTARKMPWRPRSGESFTVTGKTAIIVGPDPLGDPPRPPKWKVPGPLGAVVRLGSREFQAIAVEGSWVVCICDDGHVTRMDKAQYEVLAGVRKPPEPVPCNVLAVIDGAHVPLDQCDWVLHAPCGCPAGVHVAASGGIVFAAGEESAWLAFFSRKRERDKARRGGYRVALVTRDRLRAEVMPVFGAPCPHSGKAEVA